MIFEAGAFSMLRPFYFFEINQAGHKHGVRWATRQDLKAVSIRLKEKRQGSDALQISCYAGNT
jgi:hypothetical protein